MPICCFLNDIWVLYPTELFNGGIFAFSSPMVSMIFTIRGYIEFAESVEWSNELYCNAVMRSGTGRCVK